NNNAYCQDDELNWLDWRLLESHTGLHRFVRTLIAQRLRWMQWIEASGEAGVGMSLHELLRRAEIDWHGIALGKPDWRENSHTLACTVRSGPGRVPFWLHVMFNAYWEPLDFELPAMPKTSISGWQRWIDTARESPEDIVDSPEAQRAAGTHYRVMARSVVALFLRLGPEGGAVCLTVREPWAAR
ncbi:MAG: glycogen debranching enzyme, partial [Gammaproteobacteria bacterium]|nr:glycogen debranching enzyme [Gammaproteobacteria bacterium]